MKKIVFCIPGKTFSMRFVGSWTATLLALPEMGIIPIPQFAYIPNIYDVRNSLLGGRKMALPSYKPFDGKLDYDYIMWLDSDQVWLPEQFKALFERMENDPTLHIVSGAYVKEDGDLSLALDWESSPKGETSYLHYDQVPKHPPFMKVAFAGMGFILVRKGVFEKLEYPWFQPIGLKTEEGAFSFSGEDASFGIRAGRAGFPTWVDLTVIIGHEKSTVLGWAPHTATRE